MHEIWKMTFRKERLIAYALLCVFMKFNIDQWQFWVLCFMMALVLDKFEDSVRREYDDSTRDKLERLMKEEQEKHNGNS